FAENTDDLFVGKTLLHGDVLMWLMKTLLTSGCTNQRGAGQRRLSSRLSSLAMQVVIQGGTKLRHIRPRNGLQGFTCFDVVGRVSAVLMG
ncbi:hypothetical protein ACP8YH_19975, partial [Escherichia coli]